MTFVKKQKGFTLIETLVGSTIFVLVAMSAYNAFSALMQAIAASQAKIEATALVNERIEIIRNLPYTDVGTYKIVDGNIQYGTPPGRIKEIETVQKNGYSFTVYTYIDSMDDTFDGEVTDTPKDSSPADYKSVHLDVTCSNCQKFNQIGFTTIVGPQALETASDNGALIIRVMDNGIPKLPVAGASVHIVNTNKSGTVIVDETNTSDIDGWVKLVDAPPCQTNSLCHNVTATKSGYTTDQTYPKNGLAGPSPINNDLNVVKQGVSQVILYMDKVSSISVSTVDATCTPLPNTDFSLTGQKLIGNPNYLKYPTKNFTTDSTGSFIIQNLTWNTFPGLEWDVYNVLLTSNSYDLAGISPDIDINISQNTNTNLKMVVVPHVDKALLVFVKDSLGVPIDGASVEIQKGVFDETKTTNSGTCPISGQVFWNGLGGGTYSMTVSKSGYVTSNSNITVSNAWENQTITLATQ